ncbi:MAG: maleylacetoacetate isomerase [Rubrivivax sp.]
MLILHSFWLSLATYRVRIALTVKGVVFEERTHDLTKGEQHAAKFRAVNPAGAVPALEGATPEPLTQSLAILEWLEEVHPVPPLLPADAAGRARVRSLFLLTAADTHPLVVPRVRQQLMKRYGADEAAGADWAGHWFREGLAAYEARLPDNATRCHGEQLTIADLALASHLIGAARFKVALDDFPRVQAIGKSLMALPEVAAAHPDLQAGAPGR